MFVGNGPKVIQDENNMKMPIERRVNEYIENRSSWWHINNKWFLVRNDQNPTYNGGEWGKYCYDLLYIPEKGIFEDGNNIEMLEAENTKKKIYTVVGIGGIGAALTAIGLLAYCL